MRFSINGKTKALLKKIGCVALAFFAVFGCVAVFSGIAEKANDDYQTILPGYSIGSIDEATGKQVDEEDCIYTKNLIECTGIKLCADFDSDIKYVVHFYDDEGKWLSCLENDELELTVDEMPENAVGVRIVIQPMDDEDGEISFTEKFEYANDLSVKVRTKEVKKAD